MVPRNALVHPPVLERTAFVIYVARRDENTWFVGGTDFTDDDWSEFLSVDLATLIGFDPSLAELEDLQVGHCAFRDTRAEPWTYGVVPVGRMFFVMYDARPDQSHPERDELGGAVVSCWIVADSMDSALRLTAQYVAEIGWVIVDRMQAELAELSDTGGDLYFRQAQVDGMVAVFDTYPRDEAELN